MSGVPDVSGPEAAFPPAPVPRNCRSPHSFMSRSFGLRGTGNPSPRNRQSPHSLISRSFRPPEPFISSPGDRSHAASRRRSRMALFFLPDRAAIPPTRGRLFRLPPKPPIPARGTANPRTLSSPGASGPRNRSSPAPETAPMQPPAADRVRLSSFLPTARAAILNRPRIRGCAHLLTYTTGRPAA